MKQLHYITLCLILITSCDNNTSSNYPIKNDKSPVVTKGDKGKSDQGNKEDPSSNSLSKDQTNPANPTDLKSPGPTQTGGKSKQNSNNQNKNKSENDKSIPQQDETQQSNQETTSQDETKIPKDQQIKDKPIEEDEYTLGLRNKIKTLQKQRSYLNGKIQNINTTLNNTYSTTNIKDIKTLIDENNQTNEQKLNEISDVEDKDLKKLEFETQINQINIELEILEKNLENYLAILNNMK